MECNRDEAVKAKEMAEKKLLEKDFIGAKKLALKAQTLFPKLEGLPQFLEIVDVYNAHEEKINGEFNYYGVLGLDPYADEEELKKHYKRKALSLHPDKNKSVGADGAFMILSQAWSVLSDKEKRKAYNIKLNFRAPNQANSFSSQSTSGTTTSQPCFYGPRNTACGPGPHFQRRPWTPPIFGSWCNPAPSYPGSTMQTTSAGSQYGHSPQPPLNPTGNQQSSSSNPLLFPRHRMPSSPVATSADQFVHASVPPFQNQFVPLKNQQASSTCPPRPQTFWTLCNKCRTYFEYQTIYLKQTLSCPRCKQPFLATETPAPNKNSRSSPIPPCQQGVAAASKSMFSSVIRPFQTASGQPCGEHVKRSHETTTNMVRDNDHLMIKNSTQPKNVETPPTPCVVSGDLKREKPTKRRRKDGHYNHDAKEINLRTSRGRGASKRYFREEQSKSEKELSQLQMHALLIGKAKKEILHQLKEMESEKPDSSHTKKVEKKACLEVVMVDSVSGRSSYEGKDGLSSDPNNTLQPAESSALKETDLDEFVSMVVPDANFHNFDNDRVEESFTDGQVWAAYDNDDGMPRYYALVHHVTSRSPFKIQISWLNSRTSSEFGPLDWIASGFSKTAGFFRIGKSVVNDRLNSFSHPVKSKKGARGVIQIFPTKGDVWALYRNWSPDWDETTEDEIVHKYDLVVVLEDYIENEGVLVAPLVKVGVFTSVFKQVLEVRKIPREEMFRFSHQVPFYMLNGLEADNAPKDCFELDPAALPLELLEVITDAESAEREISRPPLSEMVEPAERRSFEDTKHLLTYSRRNKEKKVEGNIFLSQQSASLDAC